MFNFTKAKSVDKNEVRTNEHILVQMNKKSSTVRVGPKCNIEDMRRSKKTPLTQADDVVRSIQRPFCRLEKYMDWLESKLLDTLPRKQVKI